MARSSCTSCGLRSQLCQCRQEASTARNVNGERAFKLTPISSCVIYLFSILAMIGLELLIFLPAFHFLQGLSGNTCHLEIFVDALSVSNASTVNANATADWNFRFKAKSAGNGCEVSLYTIKSRLLRGNKLIAESFMPDYFGKLVTHKIYEQPSMNAVFKTVETPVSIVSGLIWDLRVEVVFTVTISSCNHYNGFLIVNCGNIPMNFTVDPTGNVKGSLLGNMRPCEYLFQEEYKDISF